MSGETEQSVSGWTVDTLHAHMQGQLNDMRSMLQERYETQTKAIDAAFIAQQTAMQTALTAAERAVQTASAAAEKAVLKAEAASDKRFEAVNEFRAQLADQQTTFMPRELGETQIALVTTLVNDTKDRVTRLETLKTGGQQVYAGLYAAAGLLISLITVAVVLIVKFG